MCYPGLCVCVYVCRYFIYIEDDWQLQGRPYTPPGVQLALEALYRRPDPGAGDNSVPYLPRGGSTFLAAVAYGMAVMRLSLGQNYSRVGAPGEPPGEEVREPIAQVSGSAILLWIICD